MSETMTIPKPAAVPDAKKFSLDDQFSIPVSEFIDTTFPVISLKNKFC